MPKENYEDLNDLFATYFSDALDEIGSFYYTKESFDGTYPGYGSSYPDLQGALALLFEQASSRGHIQDTDYGKMSFAFTIRNQYTSSFATIKAAVENKAYLRKYQQTFFKTAMSEKAPTGFAAYEFGDVYDNNRNKAFVDYLLKHKIKVYKNGNKFTVPLKQPQRRMVQTMFETYSKYRDSVFYDASAWSVANFYNMNYRGLKTANLGEEITDANKIYMPRGVAKSDYAYVMDWDDYYAPSALYYMQSKGIIAASAFKPFSIKTDSGVKEFNYGSIMIPVSKQQKLSSDEVYKIVSEANKKFNVPIYSTNTGFSVKGIDLGSNNFRTVQKPKVAMLVGDGVSSYEAGEVWHLLDTRTKMPIVKLQTNTIRGNWLDKYNTLVMVSGSYNSLDSIQRQTIRDWTANGNTLITIGSASKWAIDKKLVKEKLTTKPKPKDKKEEDEKVERLPYVDAGENLGREQLGGAIFEVDLDLTHPLDLVIETINYLFTKQQRVFSTKY
ncbi:MAG: M14 family metallopeptidase [Flavobacteriaceae bacterium]